MAIIDPAAISKLISRKHILLDNNVITKASDHPEEFKPFFDLLITSNCKPQINAFVEFEFLRGAITDIIFGKRQDLIKFINIGTLKNAYSEEIARLSISIANNYAKRKLESPNIVDCLLAASIVFFKGMQLLATTNHRDFPTFLFDRVGIFTVDTAKDVIPIGIYGYNETKAKIL